MYLNFQHTAFAVLLASYVSNIYCQSPTSSAPSVSASPGTPGVPFTIGNPRSSSVVTINGNTALSATSCLLNVILGIWHIYKMHDVATHTPTGPVPLSYPGFQDTKVTLQPMADPLAEFSFSQIFENLLAICVIKVANLQWSNSIHKIYLQGHQTGTIAFQGGNARPSGSIIPSTPVGDLDTTVQEGNTVTFDHLDKPGLNPGHVLIAIMKTMIDATKRGSRTEVVVRRIFSLCFP